MEKAAAAHCTKVQTFFVCKKRERFVGAADYVYPMMMQVSYAMGQYRYFKGDCFLVEDVVRDSETEEEFVVYRKLYGDGSLWIRPKSMFLGEVDREKYPDCPQKYRFQLQQIDSVAHKE